MPRSSFISSRGPRRSILGRLCLWAAVGAGSGLFLLAGLLTRAAVVAEDAFPGITFTQPVGLTSPVGETDRIFVLEKTGRIQVLSALGTTPVKQVFLDLSARTLSSSEQGLLGLAFHPNFSSNRFFYVFYSTTATTAAGTGPHQRVSRFTALAAPATNADILATEVPLISQFDEAENHNGGDIHFGPDGYLYISVGDEGGANDQYNNSQRIDKDFFAGLLRIDVDQRGANLAPNAHAAVHAGTYKVPADNPFVAATTFNGSTVTTAAVRTEFWAVGLRNAWRFSFDGPTGRLFLGDVGQGAREEIDLVVAGGNYGWSYREGLVAGPRGNPPAAANFSDPIWDADRTVAGSITGGVVYRGTRFSELVGKYFFGDYVKNRIFAMTLPSSGPVQVAEILTESTPVAFGVDPRNGDILVASLGTGKIRRLVSDTPSGPAPTITSQPLDQIVTVGRVVTFSAGSSTNTGIWQVSTVGTSTWTALADSATYGGTATATLTVTGATSSMDGYRYRFVAGAGNNTTASNAARLTVAPLFFPSPAGLAVDSSGGLVVSDSTANTLQKVSTSGVVSTLAGTNGTAGSTDGTGTAALFREPGGLVVTTAGVVFVADTANSTIRRIASDGAATTFAGSATGRGNNDATGTAATFSSPLGLATDFSGNFYVADSGNHTIRRITSAGIVSTFAGGASSLGSNDGAALSARFNRPSGVAVDAAGNVYVADTVNNTIRRISGGVVSTIAGLAGISGSTDGTGADALFNQPLGLAVDGSGNVYVADAGNSTIRKMSPAGVVTTLAGLPAVAGQQDGTGTRGWFNHPKSVAVDSVGNVFVADTGNAALRKVSPAGAVTTFTLSAALSPPPPTTPPTPTPPTPAPPPSSGGGGGAVEGWMVGAISLLILCRWATQLFRPADA